LIQTNDSIGKVLANEFKEKKEKVVETSDTTIFNRKKTSLSVPYPIKTGVIGGNEKIDSALSPMPVTKGSQQET